MGNMQSPSPSVAFNNHHDRDDDDDDEFQQNPQIITHDGNTSSVDVEQQRHQQQHQQQRQRWQQQQQQLSSEPSAVLLTNRSTTTLNSTTSTTNDNEVSSPAPQVPSILPSTLPLPLPLPLPAASSASLASSASIPPPAVQQEWTNTLNELFQLILANDWNKVLRYLNREQQDSNTNTNNNNNNNNDNDHDVGIPPNAIQYTYRLILHFGILQEVIQTAPVEVLKRLITVGGIDLVNIRDGLGQTFTHFLGGNGNGNGGGGGSGSGSGGGSSSLELVRHLRHVCGADIFLVKDRDGLVPLHSILQRNAPLEMIIYFVEQSRQTVQMKTNTGVLPLHIAAAAAAASTTTSTSSTSTSSTSTGNNNAGNSNSVQAPLPVVEYLVNAYPQSVHEKAHVVGYTPLHFAISNGAPSVEVIQFLIRRGGGGRQSVYETTTGDDDGEAFNAVHVAVQHGAPLHIIEYLTEQAAAGYSSSSSSSVEVLHMKSASTGYLPIHLAAAKQDTPLSVIAFLIDKGGEGTLLAQLNTGINPLGLAVSNISSIEIISYLIERGGVETVRQKTKNGFFPLHFALGNDAPFEIIQHVCDEGGRETLTEKSDVGLFAIHYAIHYRASREVVSYLHSKGGREIFLEGNMDEIVPPLYVAWYKTILSVDLHNNEEEHDEGHYGGFNDQNYELLNLILDRDSDQIMKYLDREDIPRGAFQCTDTKNNHMSILQRALQDCAPHFVIQKLVEVGGNDLLSIKDGHDNNPLHYINESTPIPSIVLLLQLCNVTALRQKNSSGHLPIHSLITRNMSIDVISAMIRLGGVATLRARDDYGWLPLHHALANGESLEIIKTLVISGGKDTLAVADSAGWIPLYIAMSRATLDVISYLTLEGGGREALLLKTTGGMLPIHYCCNINNTNTNAVDVAKFFIEEGGKELLLEKDDYDFLPIHHAVQQGNNLELVKYFIDTGGRHTLRSASTTGHLPIHFAVSTNSVEIVKLLIKEGGKTTLLCKTIDKSLPIHIAVRNEGCPEIITHVVELGGEKTLLTEDTGGWLAAHIAFNYGTSPDVYECIIRTGGKSALLHTNEFHATPLELLYNGRNKDVGLVTLIHNLLLQIGLTPSDCSEKTIMSTLNWANSLDKDSESEIMEKDEFVKMALNDKFTKSRATVFMILLDIAFQAFTVVAYSFIADLYNGRQNANLALPMAIPCLSFFILRETIEMSSTPIRVYISQASNWVDQSQIVLMSWSVRFFNQQVESPTETERLLFVWVAALAWLNILFKLGNVWYALSVLVAALVSIAQQLIPFIFTSVVVTFAFAHLFRIRYASNQECYELDHWSEADGWKDDWMSCDVTISYLKTITMFLDSGTWAEHWNFDGSIWLMITFAFVVGLLLLNIVIAVVSNIFTAVRMSAEKAFWMNRINTVCEIDSMLNLFKKSYEIITDWFKNRCICSSFFVNVKEKMTFLCCRSKKEDNDKTQQFIRFSFAIPPNEDLKELPRGVGSWWFQSEKAIPSLYFRMRTFYSLALWQEILFPDAELEAILLGRNVKSESGGSSIEMFDYVRDMRNLESRSMTVTVSLLCARVMSWLFFVVHMVGVLVVFIIGLGTFGLLWPPAMKDYLFNAGLSGENLKKRKEESKSSSSSSSPQLEAEVETLKIEVANIKQEIVNLKKDVTESQDKMMAMMNTILSEIRKEEST